MNVLVEVWLTAMPQQMRAAWCTICTQPAMSERDSDWAVLSGRRGKGAGGEAEPMQSLASSVASVAPRAPRPAPR
eukprot:1191606-Pleurochrysis_carterae.AAC.1